MTTIKIVDTSTGEEIERPMNAEELKQYEADQASNVSRQEAKAAKAAQRQAILDRLGLTADEAQILLGGN